MGAGESKAEIAKISDLSKLPREEQKVQLNKEWDALTEEQRCRYVCDFRKIDRDGSGNINAIELQLFHSFFVAYVLTHAVDGVLGRKDGCLNWMEYFHARKLLEELANKHFEKADLDGDHMISKAEWHAFVSQTMNDMGVDKLSDTNKTYIIDSIVDEVFENDITEIKEVELRRKVFQVAPSKSQARINYAKALFSLSDQEVAEHQHNFKLFFPTAKVRMTGVEAKCPGDFMRCMLKLHLEKIADPSGKFMDDVGYIFVKGLQAFINRGELFRPFNESGELDKDEAVECVKKVLDTLAANYVGKGSDLDAFCKNEKNYAQGRKLNPLEDVEWAFTGANAGKKISYEKLCAHLTRDHLASKYTDMMAPEMVESCAKAFRKMDNSGDGFIELEEVAAIHSSLFAELWFAYAHTEVDSIIAGDACHKSDGLVTFQEFSKAMLNYKEFPFIAQCIDAHEGKAIKSELIKVVQKQFNDKTDAHASALVAEIFEDKDEMARDDFMQVFMKPKFKTWGERLEKAAIERADPLEVDEVLAVFDEQGGSEAAPQLVNALTEFCLHKISRDLDADAMEELICELKNFSKFYDTELVWKRCPSCNSCTSCDSCNSLSTLDLEYKKQLRHLFHDHLKFITGACAPGSDFPEDGMAVTAGSLIKQLEAVVVPDGSKKGEAVCVITGMNHKLENYADAAKAARRQFKKKSPHRFFAIMTVTIKSCKGLRDADWVPGSAKSDPYCVIEVVGKAGKQLDGKTETVNSSCDPVWEDNKGVVQIPINLMTAYVPEQFKIRVMDQDTYDGDDHLGEVMVDLLKCAVDEHDIEANLVVKKEGDDKNPTVTYDLSVATFETRHDWELACLIKLEGKSEEESEAQLKDQKEDRTQEILRNRTLCFDRFFSPQHIYNIPFNQCEERVLHLALARALFSDTLSADSRKLITMSLIETPKFTVANFLIHFGQGLTLDDFDGLSTCECLEKLSVATFGREPEQPIVKLNEIDLDKNNRQVVLADIVRMIKSEKLAEKLSLNQALDFVHMSQENFNVFFLSKKKLTNKFFGHRATRDARSRSLITIIRSQIYQNSHYV